VNECDPQALLRVPPSLVGWGGTVQVHAPCTDLAPAFKAAALCTPWDCMHGSAPALCCAAAAETGLLACRPARPLAAPTAALLAPGAGTLTLTLTHYPNLNPNPLP